VRSISRPDKEKDPDRERKLPTVREFITALAEHIHDRHHISQDDDENEVDSIEIELEQLIMPQIYKQAFGLVEIPEEDALLHSKCNEYAHVSQFEMNISEGFQSPEKNPFSDAITKLRTISVCLTPGKQLYSILNAAQSVYETLQEYHPHVTIGGDAFMDIWLFVVLKANVRKISSIINFIREYANLSFLQGELGYYFSTLELAVAFIRELTPEKMRQTSDSSTTGKLQFVVCERSKLSELVSRKPILQIAYERVEIPKYKMFVVDDWLFDPVEFHNVVLFYTGNENDKIVASVVKIKDKFVTPQERLYYESFFLQANSSTFVHCHSEYGNVLVGDEKKYATNFLVPVSDGDFDKHMESIRLNLTLRRLGFNRASWDTPLTDDEKIRFLKHYKIRESLPFDQALKNLIILLQILLRTTGYLPPTNPIDGCYNDSVFKAVQKFQKHFNREESSSLSSISENSSLSQLLSTNFDKNDKKMKSDNILLDLLEEDNSSLWPSLADNGLMSYDCLTKLQEYFDELERIFACVGYKIEGTVFERYKEFSDLISTFQRSVKLIPTGQFTEKTIEFLKDAYLNSNTTGKPRTVSIN